MILCPDFDGDLNRLIEFVIENPDFLGEDEVETIPVLESNIASIETEHSNEELNLIEL